MGLFEDVVKAMKTLTLLHSSLNRAHDPSSDLYEITDANRNVLDACPDMFEAMNRARFISYIGSRTHVVYRGTRFASYLNGEDDS